MCSSTPPLFGTLNKPAMVTTWNKSSAELPTSFIITTPNEHQDVLPTWSRALGGSLYSIDGSQIDYVVLYSEWFGRCHYRLHPTKRHPYKRFSMSVSTTGNQRRIQVLLLPSYYQWLESASYLCYRCPDPAGIQGRSLKPVFPTHVTLLEQHQNTHSFNQGCGAIYLFYPASQFYAE